MLVWIPRLRSVRRDSSVLVDGGCQCIFHGVRGRVIERELEYREARKQGHIPLWNLRKTRNSTIPAIGASCDHGVACTLSGHDDCCRGENL